MSRPDGHRHVAVPLKAIFYEAVQNDYVHKNPFDFSLSSVIENDTVSKVPLTPDQVESLLAFVQQDNTYRKYYENLVILTDLVRKYNKHSDNKLEKLSPHLLRRTFCTNMANAGMNPKALQYIMGHASINMTLNYYAHPTLDSAKAEMERISA